MGLSQNKVSSYENKVHTTNVGLIRGKKAYEDPVLVADLEFASRAIFPHIINQDMEYAIKWLLGCDRYVKDKTNDNPQVNFPFGTYTISRGEVIYVDLFGHFDKELTFFHPAIVIAEIDRKHILIAPTSTPAYGTGNPLHVDLTPTDARRGVLHNCGIKLDNLRVISKRRISKRFGKITNMAILDEIDNALLKNYIPMKEQLVVNQRQEIDAKTSFIEQLELDIAAKDEEIENQKNEFQRREMEMEELKATIQALQEQLEAVLQPNQ